jgi:DNA repair exonuclease SbcCD ATPase subunit
LALAYIAQQAGAIGGTLASVVRKAPTTALTLLPGVEGTPGPATPPAPPAQPDAVNVAASITAGHVSAAVTLDAAGEKLLDALDERLSQAAQAVFALSAQADRRAASLDGAIGRVAGEICALRPAAVQIGGHLCELTGEIRAVKHILHEELACLCRSARAIARHVRGEEPEGEQIREHPDAASGHEIRTVIEHLRERMETRFADMEAARLAAAARSLEERDRITALRDAQEETRQWLAGLAGRVEQALESRELRDALLGLEARVEGRLADLAADRDQHAKRAADAYEGVLARFGEHARMREQLERMPAEIGAVVAAAVDSVFARLDERIEAGFAAIAALQHDHAALRQHLERLAAEVAAEARDQQVLEQFASQRAWVESQLAERLAGVQREQAELGRRLERVAAEAAAAAERASPDRTPPGRRPVR